MNRSNLDLLLTTMIACMDEIDPVVPAAREQGDTSDISPVSDEEILCHWMDDICSQIDHMVVDETNQL